MTESIKRPPLTSWSGYPKTQEKMGDNWEFSAATAQPDLIAIELLEAMALVVRVNEAFIEEVRANPAVFRHFRKAEPDPAPIITKAGRSRWWR